jgi:cytochrome d ubiquinol oxidase subunit II
MEYQILWFILWGVLWAVYFMLDGFDLGVGILHNFLGKSNAEKRTIINTIGPVWDGNEVWLITAGGATFAAFPTTYALMFSYLYTPLLLILFALIVRGVAFEFRGKGGTPAWERGWDAAIFVGSFLPALLFGVAFGNIFQGLPMDAAGYHGTLRGLLNPYGILTGLFFVLLFLVHGALWLAFRTSADLAARSARLALTLWHFLVVTAVAFLLATAFATGLYKNFMKAPLWFSMPLLAVLSLFGIKLLAARGKFASAFAASCTAIVAVIFTGIIGLYPNLIPSSIDPRHNLTIFNSSSSVYTLRIMTFVALLFMPVVAAYQVWIYRIFRHRITPEEVVRDPDAY